MEELQSIKNKFGIIGNDPNLNYALQVAAQVASTDLSALILGESGVGKEAFSRIIHELSSRKHNQFIAINCGAIPEGTIDSELFGHEKGAFTGAADARKGYFEVANGGTIFLDEIGEMPLGTQARLLRVLESGEYIRVGSSKVLHTNVRVVAATNKDLLALGKEKKFREDLYYRLSTVPIRVPALRDRKEDINILFRKFCVDFADKYNTAPIRLDEGAQLVLKNYAWPGNIRELKNLAQQISVLSPSKMVTAEMLQTYLPSSNTAPTLLGSGAGMGGIAPSFSAQQNSDPLNSTEREILYKLFFELKKDINDVKQGLFEIMSQGTFPMNNVPRTAPSEGNYVLPNNYLPMPAASNNAVNTSSEIKEFNPTNSSNTVIINPKDAIDHHEDVEESLSLVDREKEFIIKALKKHKGKRKDAAQELGISERTLYRKINEYDIEE